MKFRSALIAVALIALLFAGLVALPQVRAGTPPTYITADNSSAECAASSDGYVTNWGSNNVGDTILTTVTGTVSQGGWYVTSPAFSGNQPLIADFNTSGREIAVYAATAIANSYYVQVHWNGGSYNNWCASAQVLRGVTSISSVVENYVSSSTTPSVTTTLTASDMLVAHFAWLSGDVGVSAGTGNLTIHSDGSYPFGYAIGTGYNTGTGSVTWSASTGGAVSVDVIGIVASGASATAPNVITNTPSSVGGTWALLSGAVNDTGTCSLPYTQRFQWGAVPFFSYSATVGTSSIPATWNDNVTNLTPSTMYQVEAGAFCDYGSGGMWTDGNIAYFNTSAAPMPILTTHNATSIGGHYATLHGTLDSINGSASNVTFGFWYGMDPSIASPFTNVTLGNTSTTPHNYSKNVSVPLAGTTYYFRAWGFGSWGLGEGGILNFTTPSSPAAVLTVNTTNVGVTDAVFKGVLTSMGTSSAVEVGFYYGPDPTLNTGNNTTLTVIAGNLTAPGPFSYHAGNLSQSTTYYDRAWALGDVAVLISRVDAEFGETATNGSLTVNVTIPAHSAVFAWMTHYTSSGSPGFNFTDTGNSAYTELATSNASGFTRQSLYATFDANVGTDFTVFSAGGNQVYLGLVVVVYMNVSDAAVNVTHTPAHPNPWNTYVTASHAASWVLAFGDAYNCPISPALCLNAAGNLTQLGNGNGNNICGVGCGVQYGFFAGDSNGTVSPGRFLTQWNFWDNSQAGAFVVALTPGTSPPAPTLGNITSFTTITPPPYGDYAIVMAFFAIIITMLVFAFWVRRRKMGGPEG